MIETRRLIISEAGYSDISAVIELESHEDNRDYLWIGTEEEHRSEIEDQDHLLLMFRKKEDRKTIGYALVRLNRKSEIFELRRIAISDKRKGYGRESMKALLKYAASGKPAIPAISWILFLVAPNSLRDSSRRTRRRKSLNFSPVSFLKSTET